MSQAKKLAAVGAISTSVTSSLEVLHRVTCIWYSVQFQANQVKALIDSCSKVNVMTLVFAAKIGFTPKSTNVGILKIDGSPLKTYGMVSAEFLLQDSLGKVRFFIKLSY